MTQTTLEYVHNAMYIALVSAVDARQRAAANDTMALCADFAMRAGLRPGNSAANCSQRRTRANPTAA